MKHLIAVAALLTLGACAGKQPTISAEPQQTVLQNLTSTKLGGTVVTGLQDAAWNLDQAIAIKVLPPTDPADACVHGALQKIGQDIGQTAAPPAPSFQAKVSDLISAGSVAYILAQQAKALAAQGPGAIVPAQCEQLIGHFVLNGVNAPANATVKALSGLLP